MFNKDSKQRAMTHAHYARSHTCTENNNNNNNNNNNKQICVAP